MPFFTVSFVGQHPVASGIIRIDATDRNDAAFKLGKIIPVIKIRGVWMSSEQGRPGALPKIIAKAGGTEPGTRQAVLVC